MTYFTILDSEKREIRIIHCTTKEQVSQCRKTLDESCEWMLMSNLKLSIKEYEEAQQ